LLKEADSQPDSAGTYQVQERLRNKGFFAYFFILPTVLIRIPHPGDIRLGSLPGGKGGIVGGSRIFGGMGVPIRRGADVAEPYHRPDVS